MTPPDELQTRLKNFAVARDWEQFHTPKNLVMALSGEVGELTEIFQWLTAEESSSIMDTPESAARVREELADVYAYLLQLANQLGVNLNDALNDKIAVNEAKYPADRVRGSAAKYTTYQSD